MRACVSAGRKGIKKGGCAARRRKKVILKKKREKKYRGPTCFGFWTMIQKQRPIRPSCFPIITRIQYPPCIRKISFSLFFSREVQGDVVTSLMLVPAVLRFSSSFPISFPFPSGLTCSTRRTTGSTVSTRVLRGAPTYYAFVLWKMARL